jgi:hypothetical protein
MTESRNDSKIVTYFLAALRLLFMQNWITMLGATLATVSAWMVLLFIFLGAVGRLNNPYQGMIAFLILPAFFVAGLLIIPIGLWLQRRRRRLGLTPAPLVVDFRDPATREAAAIVIILTLVNFGIVGAVSYQGYQYTESTQFCGQVCHSVMQPEYTAYIASPHSRVRCTECHIGPGAPWFVRAKLSGLRQVYNTLVDAYPRPIPVPVHNLRPSRDTCEHCHWPEKFSGDRLLVRRKFSEDEQNTPLTTVLLMHIGGGNSNSHGIHSWHIHPHRRTLYLPKDEKRQEIALVRVIEPDGRVENFAAADFEGDPSAVPDEAMRVMDCMDCHNRPTHIFQLPGAAMDDAMVHGRIDNTLPWIKKLGVEALTQAEQKDDPLGFISQHIRGFYQENSPDILNARRDTVERAIASIQELYRRNVFPSMNVTWGTYPDNRGHTDFPGCFRCHDDGHTTPDGKSIRQDCTLCHQVLAWDEEKPEVLATLGVR